MQTAELAELASLAARAADRARHETVSRFRHAAVETKLDGSPVTEADRAAERAIREVLREGTPDFAILGEEYGDEDAGAGTSASRPRWLVDPIDGTIGYARGLPLFSTLIALEEAGEPVLGLIDLPGFDERFVGWNGGGVRRNGEAVKVSDQTDLSRAMVAHGDVFAFEFAGIRDAFEEMVRRIPMVRGYTDAFGHALVIGGGVDAMVDCCLNPWDAAATRILVREAGGACEVWRWPDHDKLDLVFGSPALVEALCEIVEQARR